MKFIYKACLLLSVVFLLSGCWDYNELTKQSIVTGLAFDKGKEQKYKLTIEATTASELNTRTAQGMAPSWFTHWREIPLES